MNGAISPEFNDEGVLARVVCEESSCTFSCGDLFAVSVVSLSGSGLASLDGMEADYSNLTSILLAVLASHPILFKNIFINY